MATATALVRIAFEQFVESMVSAATAGNDQVADQRLQHLLRSAHQGSTLDAATWIHLCWWATLYGYVHDVVDSVCQWAVDLAEPDELAAANESRGLARAITGDVDGAIEDLSAYLVADPDSVPETRLDWVDRLRAGEDPERIFDAEMLETLKNE